MRANPNDPPLYVPEQWTREVLLEMEYVAEPAPEPAPVQADGPDDAMFLTTAVLFAWALVLALGIGGIVLATMTQSPAVAMAVTAGVIIMATGGSLLAARFVVRLVRA